MFGSCFIFGQGIDRTMRAPRERFPKKETKSKKHEMTMRKMYHIMNSKMERTKKECPFWKIGKTYKCLLERQTTARNSDGGRCRSSSSCCARADGLRQTAAAAVVAAAEDSGGAPHQVMVMVDDDGSVHPKQRQRRGRACGCCCCRCASEQKHDSCLYIISFPKLLLYFVIACLQYGNEQHQYIANTTLNRSINNIFPAIRKELCLLTVRLW
jgi:hypothetical protein